MNRMKAKLPILGALALLLGGAVSQGCAHDRSAAETSHDRQRDYLTGSYLPQDVERNGPVTNGKNDVRVLDRSDLNHSGGADVRQSLRELGVSP